MKDVWKDYFSFNKKQRRGIFALLLLIVTLLIYLAVADYFPTSANPVDFSSFKTELAKAGIKTNTIKSSKYPTRIEVNSADTSLLMTLPKMTFYCAGMIVKYRKKLGGYYAINQLHEVWGMDSAMYNAMLNKIWIDTTQVHKININTADIRQLSYHPYIRYYLAKAIVNFREEHGLFASLGSLHKMAAIDDSTYLKILPYLSVSK